MALDQTAGDPRPSPDRPHRSPPGRQREAVYHPERFPQDSGAWRGQPRSTAQPSPTSADGIINRETASLGQPGSADASFARTRFPVTQGELHAVGLPCLRASSLLSLLPTAPSHWRRSLTVTVSLCSLNSRNGNRVPWVNCNLSFALVLCF